MVLRYSLFKDKWIKQSQTTFFKITLQGKSLLFCLSTISVFQLCILITCLKVEGSSWKFLMRRFYLSHLHFKQACGVKDLENTVRWTERSASHLHRCRTHCHLPCQWSERREFWCRWLWEVWVVLWMVGVVLSGRWSLGLCRHHARWR